VPRPKVGRAKAGEKPGITGAQAVTVTMKITFTEAIAVKVEAPGAES
jgi:hypothetical protein